MVFRRLFSALLTLIIMIAGLIPLGPIASPTLLAQDGASIVDLEPLVEVVSDDGLIQLMLPEPWQEVQSGPWDVGSVPFGLLLEASSDLEDLYAAKSVSGIAVAIAPNSLPGMSEFMLLGWHDSLADTCEDQSVSDEALEFSDRDGVAEVAVNQTVWLQCGLHDLTVVVAEAQVADSSQGLFVVAQLQEGQSPDVVLQILGSIRIGSSAELLAAMVAGDSGDEDNAESDEVSADSTTEEASEGAQETEQQDSEVGESEEQESARSSARSSSRGGGESSVVASDGEASDREASDGEPADSELANDELILLRLNLQEGASYFSRVIIDQLIDQELPGQSLQLEQTIGMEYRYEIESIDDVGTALIRVTYDWISFEMKGNPAGDISYDSADPPAEIPPMAMGFAGLVDGGFTIEVSSAGKVLEISGLDEMFDNMVAQMDLPPGPERDAILESVQTQFGDEAMTSTMEQAFNIYPDEPVGIGDSWARDFVITGGFPMVLGNRWTLTGRDSGKSTFEVSSTIETNDDAPPLDMGGIEMTYSLSGSQRGTMTVAEESGWTIAASMVQLMDGELTAVGMNIPMTIESRFTITGWVDGTTAADGGASDDAQEESAPEDPAQEDESTSASDSQDEGDQAQEADSGTNRSSARRTTRATEGSADTTSEEDDSTTDDSTTDDSTTDESTVDESTNDASANDEAEDEADTVATDAVGANENDPLAVARSLAADGKVDEAIAAFEAALADDPALELDPVDATITAMVEAGEALYFQDKTWQALQLYSDAIELDPSRADAYVGRASVYRWFEEFDKALADLGTAIELGRDDYNYATAYAERGYIYYQQNDYERTVADLTRAIEAQAKSDAVGNAWYYELRGYAHREMDNLSDALADFTSAIDLDEDEYNYKWAFINRAGIYRDFDEPENALADASAAIELDPIYTWGYELRGRIYSDLEEHQKSIADLTKAIDFDQEDYDYSIAFGYRGYEYHQLDEYFEAVADLTEAIRLLPTYTWAYEIRGDAHSDNKQYTEAVDDYTAALALESENYDYSGIYASRGIAYYEQAEYADAIADFDEAIAIEPDYTWAYEWRGYSQADIENYEAAVRDFTSAINVEQSGYDYKWSYANRANSYYNLNELDLAIEDLNVAVDLDDEFTWAYEVRGEVFGLMGRHDVAMDDYRRVTELSPRDAGSWNTLCWFGALWGFAAEVVDDACESAVAFADDDDKPFYRDSRGVARALTGDAEGALADFRAFASAYDNELRSEWIERLEDGEEPSAIFDESMILALWEESGLPVDGTSTVEDSEGASESRAPEPSVGLQNFTLDPSDKLEAVPPMGSMLAFSKDGSFRLASPGDPLFMAVPLTSPSSIEDPSDFALLQLELTANAEVAAIESHKAITINGLTGFESIATGNATSQEVALLIYQAILYDGDNYLIFKGVIAETERDEYLPEFQSMAESVSWP